MKTSSLAALAAVALGVFSASAALADSGTKVGRRIDLVVVAEQTPEARQTPRAAPDHPVPIIAIDGGYIEAGDSIAGERPPTPSAVAEPLRDSLAAQGYTIAAAGNSPALAVVYYWGVIRPVMNAPRPASHLEPNFKARLSLGAPSRTVHDMELDIVSRRLGPRIEPHFRFPDWEDAFQVARGGRYFLVLAAYDYSALAQGQRTLFWQTRLSTQDTSGYMDEAIAALAASAGTYAGKDISRAVFDYAHLVAPASGNVNPASLAPNEFMSRINPQVLHDLLGDLFLQYSGDYYTWKKRFGAPVSQNATSVPPALAQRINNYQREKATLQNELAARIKDRNPGGDTRSAIDRFNAENSGRIAHLASEREAIRAQLAQLAANRPAGAVDNSLDVLGREFAADVQQIEKETVAARP